MTHDNPEVRVLTDSIGRMVRICEQHSDGWTKEEKRQAATILEGASQALQALLLEVRTIQ